MENAPRTPCMRVHSSNLARVNVSLALAVFFRVLQLMNDGVTGSTA